MSFYEAGDKHFNVRIYMHLTQLNAKAVKKTIQI